MADAVERQAARVLVVDDDDRVLLVEVTPSGPGATPYWITPGGGVEPGETHDEAARRELVEETGLRPSVLTGPVHRDVATFASEGVTYRQTNRFFVTRVPRGSVVAATALTDLEVRSTTGDRWWSLSELRATSEAVYPPDLPDLLHRVLNGPLAASAGVE